MRISDWSSDVCSSDLRCLDLQASLLTARNAQRVRTLRQRVALRQHNILLEHDGRRVIDAQADVTVFPCLHLADGDAHGIRAFTWQSEQVDPAHTPDRKSVV